MLLRNLFEWKFLLAGAMTTLGFAPFHLPGLAIIALAYLFWAIEKRTLLYPFFSGLTFGVGFFGAGISWVYVSIHAYGHLNPFLSILITCLLITYLSLYPALVIWSYKKLRGMENGLFNGILFCSLWCLSEYLRATLMGGFPWLLIGFGQIDSPIKEILPILGVYGGSFLACFAAVALVMSQQKISAFSRANMSWYQYGWLITFVFVLLIPLVFKYIPSPSLQGAPLPVSVIQANLSMRDKWDEKLFWQLLRYYEQATLNLLKPNRMVILPESAIPIPDHYIPDFLDGLDVRAKQRSSAIILGIPHIDTEEHYYNTLTTLGNARGVYQKQHLVPFGEFIPSFLHQLIAYLGVSIENLHPGNQHQPLVEVFNHPIATLICYELAYPSLLRQQLPSAEWIVSISDDGWFGHSLAMYQQLQMAQTLSKMSGRFQIMANNDGLSSIIDNKGTVIASLPAFSTATLNGSVQAATGETPWVHWGDTPCLIMYCAIMLAALLRKTLVSRRYLTTIEAN